MIFVILCSLFCFVLIKFISVKKPRIISNKAQKYSSCGETSTKTMDALNDDCLELILQLLALKDQIAVVRASKRFIPVMRSIWKTKYKNRLELYLYRGVPLAMDELKVFLSNVNEDIKHVLIDSESFELINELRQFQFTKTNRLDINVNGTELLRHESVAMLFQIFPNIRILYPIGKFTGEGFTLWKNLKELTLTFCFNLNFYYLEHILHKLPLRTLQLKASDTYMPPLGDHVFQNSPLSELIVNSYELAYFTPQIRHIRHLKYLDISDIFSTSNLNALNNELANLRETHCIEGFSSRDVEVILPKIIKLRLHSHLRRLLLTLDPIAFSEMLTYIPLLPSLRVLYFQSCYVRKNEDFQKLFSVSNHLDEISIENCTITYNSKPCLNVNEIVEQRTKFLIFNYFGNKFSDDTKAELITSGSSELFKVECIQKVVRSYRYLLYEFSKHL